MDQNFAVIVLAAGASVHRKKPKQLLPYLGKTLIEHAARTALASGAREVVVVVGQDAATIREKLKYLPVRVVFNRDWSEGISSSIRCGLEAISQSVRCAVIALCDQPRITPGLLGDLARRQFETGSAIVASSYDGIVGAPSAFGIEVFPELLSLHGPCGAREIIRQSPVPIETIEFSGGNVEIDNPTDYQARTLPPASALIGDMCRDPRDARGPPSATVKSSFSA